MLAHAFWLADLPLHIRPIRPDPFQRLFTSEALSRQSRTRDRPGASQPAHSLHAGWSRPPGGIKSRSKFKGIKMPLIQYPLGHHAMNKRARNACQLLAYFCPFQPVLRASQGGA